MRAVRAVDGAAYDIDIAGNAVKASYDSLRAHLSEISGIPACDLVTIQPNGRQIDEQSARILTSPRSHDQGARDGLEPVFLFDRQLIELDPDGRDAAEYLNETDYVLEQVLNEVRDDRGYPCRLLILQSS
jgi:hypothetical protein